MGRCMVGSEDWWSGRRSLRTDQCRYFLFFIIPRFFPLSTWPFGGGTYEQSRRRTWYPGFSLTISPLLRSSSPLYEGFPQWYVGIMNDKKSVPTRTSKSCSMCNTHASSMLKTCHDCCATLNQGNARSLPMMSWSQMDDTLTVLSMILSLFCNLLSLSAV